MNTTTPKQATPYAPAYAVSSGRSARAVATIKRFFFSLKAQDHGFTVGYEMCQIPDGEER